MKKIILFVLFSLILVPKAHAVVVNQVINFNGIIDFIEGSGHGVSVGNPFQGTVNLGYDTDTVADFVGPNSSAFEVMNTSMSVSYNGMTYTAGGINGLTINLLNDVNGADSFSLFGVPDTRFEDFEVTFRDLSGTAFNGLTQLPAILNTGLFNAGSFALFHAELGSVSGEFPVPIPEPATLILLSAGFFGLVLRRKS